MMSRREVYLLALAGLALTVSARLALPLAPPLYDSITLPSAPYRWCSPPSDLASSNQPPQPGKTTLKVDNGSSAIGSLNTADQQVVAFFPQGAFSAAGASSIDVSVTPMCAGAPTPPSHVTLVGNAYDVEATGKPGNVPARLGGQAQMLLRIPAGSRYSTIAVFADGRWQTLTWSAQPPDYANLVLARLGQVAALNEPSRHAQAVPGPGFNAGVIIEAALVLLAAAIIIAAVLAQRARQKPASTRVRRGFGPSDARRASPTRKSKRRR